MARDLSPWAVALLAGPCSHCGAPAGQRCVRGDGTDQGHFHHSRFTRRDLADHAATTAGFRPVNQLESFLEAEFADVLVPAVAEMDEAEE